MRRHTFMRSTLLFVTALVLAACGDDNDDKDPIDPGDDDEIGSMNASVTGDVTETVTGGAYYAAETDGSWGLLLGGDEEGESLIFITGEGSRPGTGTHVFDPDLGAYYYHGASDGLYFAEEGELTVTQSSSARVAGSFEFTATDGQGAVVSVEGTFDAPNIDAP